MNTQMRKNSVCIAMANYRMRKRERELKIRLAVFFAVLCVTCVFLAAVIASLPY